MRRIISILILTLLSAFVAFAQTSIKVQAPNLVGLNEQFNITFVISGEDAPSDFEWEPSSDFQVVWGPQKGTSRSTSIINGKRTSSSQTTYTYVLLPKKVGHFQLSAANVKVKGKQYRSDQPVVEVVSDGAASSNTGSNGQSNSGSEPKSNDISADDLFLRLSFSKRNVIVGEPITATLKLYQRVSISGFENVRFPEFNGFWSQELQAPSNIEFVRESLDDKIYNSALLRSWTLIPQKAGDITIDPAEMVCLVNIKLPSNSMGSIFDSFFQDDFQTIRKRVSTKPINIKVSALPAGAPASFGGGVGKFSMSAKLTKESLSTHDAASLQLSVTGSGNISLLEAPKIVFPADFEVYDAKVSDINGGKLFEYPFIPRSHGDFTIAPIEYSYFDINSRKYVSLRTEPLELSVAKSNSDNSTSLVSSQTGVAATNQKGVRSLGEDIRFIISNKPALSSAGAFFAGSPFFWIIVIALVAICLCIYLGLRSIAARRADVVGTKNRSAVKMARKRLVRSKELLDKDLNSAFYEELHRALLGYVSDKFNMDANDMSKDNIAERLTRAMVPEQYCSQFVGLLDDCEFARYAPNSGHDAMNTHYQTAISTISMIEENIKHQRKAGGNMLTALIAICLLLPSLSAFGSEPTDSADASEFETLWSAGVRAYEQGEWSAAIENWSAIEDGGATAWQLCYNIANAYYRLDDISHAILYYERALKLNPSSEDARFNLELAYSRTQDKIEAVPEFFLKSWARSLCWLLPSNVWACISIVLFSLCLAMVLLFLLGRNSKTRLTGFIFGIICLLLTLACSGLAFWQKNDYQNADSAIVTRAVSTIKSSPSAESAKDLFILHEGTKVRVLDTLGSWYNIELADGRQGWMLVGDGELI